MGSSDRGVAGRDRITSMTPSDERIEAGPAYEKRTRVQKDDELSELDREAHARAHFPNLGSSVAPRESDEYPTFWEDV